MLSNKYQHILDRDTKLFRSFIREYGKVKLRRLLLALESNQSIHSIVHTLEVPQEDVEAIQILFRRIA